MNIMPFDIPADIAVCPICKSGLRVAEVNGCSQGDDGEWIAEDVFIECKTEPEIEDDEWEDWHDGHYRMPYVDWLPVHVRVEAWVRKAFRVVDSADGWKLILRDTIAPYAT